MKKLVYALIMTGIIAAMLCSLAGCADPVVTSPSRQVVEQDFLNYATVGGSLPFTCTMASFSMEGQNSIGYHICDVKAEVTMQYNGELFAVMQYEAQLKYVRRDNQVVLDYVACHTTRQLSGFDLPQLLDESVWVFDPDNNFGHSVARNEKLGLPSSMEWGEVPEAGEGGISDREMPVKIIYSAEIDNEVKANFYIIEKFSDALEVEFEWDFRITYATDNGLYLDFLHVGEALDSLDNWVLVSRATSSMKAEVVYMLKQ